MFLSSVSGPRGRGLTKDDPELKFAIKTALTTFVFLSLFFFLPILPSFLYVWRIAFDVENLRPNSLAAWRFKISLR